MPSPFEPIEVGSLTVPNRLAMAPIKTAYGGTDGRITKRHVAYFGRRAKGGVGLIISEPLYVDKRGQEHPKQLGIDSDDKLEGLASLTEAVHKEGSRIFAHLNHGGRAANPKAAGGPPEAPSNVPCPRTGFEPEVLTNERIEEIIRKFAEAAQRAQKAGFDGVELQFGLGYLVAQFMSPATNSREDDWGGDLERRMRFPADVFKAVRQAVGDDFPIGVRISGSEKAPGGLEIEDAKDLARRLESWGANLIHVATGSNCESLPWYFQHMALPPGVNEKLASQVKEVVGIPVMAAGRLGDPPVIRELLEGDKLDMVALGRPLLADPELPAKMRENRDEEVMLCGHCLQGCFVKVKSGQAIGCNVNPEVGDELLEVASVAQPKSVVVVGGGPAGMQAALTADGRGHRVTLFEKGALGGQFATAFIPPGKRRLEKPLKSLIAKVQRSRIDLKLGEEATLDKIKALKPDAVVLATGSRPVVPNIPGLENSMTGEEALTKIDEVGNRVLVLGGGMIGMEVAEFLAKSGRHCVVVEMLEDVAGDMDPITKKLMMMRIQSLPVEVHTQTELKSAKENRAIATHKGAEIDLGSFDTFVVAVGNSVYLPFIEELQKEGITVTTVGDAIKPARIFDAVLSGHQAAMSL